MNTSYDSHVTAHVRHGTPLAQPLVQKGNQGRRHDTGSMALAGGSSAGSCDRALHRVLSFRMPLRDPVCEPSASRISLGMKDAMPTVSGIHDGERLRR
jgi:hypothetical protein